MAKNRSITPDSFAHQQETLDKLLKNGRTEVESSARLLHELVFRHQFKVDMDDVVYYAVPPPDGQVVQKLGKPYVPRFKTFLSVTPHNSELPIRQLFFDGYSEVYSGASITALIPCFDILVDLGPRAGHIPASVYFSNESLPPPRSGQIDYVPREFRRLEQAIEITFSFDSFPPSFDVYPPRTDRSADYAVYQKPR